MKNEKGSISVVLPLILLLIISTGITIYQKYSYNIMDDGREYGNYLDEESNDLKLNKNAR